MLQAKGQHAGLVRQRYIPFMKSHLLGCHYDVSFARFILLLLCSFNILPVKLQYRL